MRRRRSTDARRPAWSATGRPRRADRPVRTQPVRVDRRRSGDHHGRDLHVARRGELRQQDDVVADRRRADRGPGRDRVGVLAARRAHRAAAGLGGDRGQRPAGHLPALRGVAQRPGGITGYNLEAGPPVFAPLLASLVGGMGLLAAVLRREGRHQHPPRVGRGQALMPYRSPDQRAVTPQHRGRFPGFDVLDSVEAWDDVTAGVVLGRLALPGELAFFTPAEVGIAGAAAGSAARPGRRPAGPGAGPDRRPAGRGGDRRLALRRPARGRARPGATRCASSTRTRSSVTHGRGFAHLLSDEQAAAGPGGAGSQLRRAEAGTAGRRRTCGACGPATPAPRSTPTPGPGTRSASPARPTRAATSTPASTPANTGKSPDGHRGQRHRPGHLRRPRRTGPPRAPPASSEADVSAR